jgi:hypothetical protein
MTEQEWLECAEPEPMLATLLSRQITDRKLRLLLCAAFRSMLPWLKADGRAVVEKGELFADGKVSQTEAALERRIAYQLGGQQCVSLLLEDTVVERMRPVLSHELWVTSRNRKSHATLIRHLVGNLFRPYPAPLSWPALVVDLAQQFYDGADVRLILHDALLDAGHAELASHIQQEEWHPKGCWVLDLVLGKS